MREKLASAERIREDERHQFNARIEELRRDKEELKGDRDRLLRVIEEQAGTVKLLMDQSQKATAVVSTSPKQQPGLLARLFGTPDRLTRRCEFHRIEHELTSRLSRRGMLKLATDPENHRPETKQPARGAGRTPAEPGNDLFVAVQIFPENLPSRQAENCHFRPRRSFAGMRTTPATGLIARRGTHVLCSIVSLGAARSENSSATCP